MSTAFRSCPGCRGSAVIAGIQCPCRTGSVNLIAVTGAYGGQGIAVTPYEETGRPSLRHHDLGLLVTSDLPGALSDAAILNAAAEVVTRNAGQLGGVIGELPAGAAATGLNRAANVILRGQQSVNPNG